MYVICIWTSCLCTHMLHSDPAVFFSRQFIFTCGSLINGLPMVLSLQCHMRAQLHNTFVEPHDVSSSLRTNLVMTETSTAVVLLSSCKQHVHNASTSNIAEFANGRHSCSAAVSCTSSSSTCARQKPISRSTVISEASQSQDCSNVLIMRSRSATVCLAAFSSCCRACHCTRFIGSIVCTSTEGGTQTSSPILWEIFAVV